MGTLVAFRPTVQSILREGRREIERMYRLSAGGEDPLVSAESRELFEPGLIDEVQWQDWETYCKGLLNRMFLET